MLDMYFYCGEWIVTYQRNKYSKIVTLYCGTSEVAAQATFDKFIEMWG